MTASPQRLPQKSRAHRSLVAFEHRNFRLIWIGLLLSMTGSMMQNAALLWQVSLLVPPERKGLALGLVGLVRVVPIIVFSLFSGVVADAWDRRKLMLFTQTGSAIVALALAWLTFRGLSAVWPSMRWRRSAPQSALSTCRRVRRCCRRSCRASICRTRSA